VNLAETRKETFDQVRERTYDPARGIVVCAEDEQTPRSLADAVRAARQRRIVQFDDSSACYLVASDGLSLANIGDQATFLANHFVWSQVERLPASQRALYRFLQDDDPESKLAAGLRHFEQPAEPEQPLEVLEETPSRIRLKVSRQRPGYLSIRNTWDPGWRARVGGREVPVLRADYAFQALEIPPGTWEVELYYLPRSLVLGLWIVAACAAVSAAAWWLSRRGSPVRAVLP
jgi:hypothetical protein